MKRPCRQSRLARARVAADAARNPQSPVRRSRSAQGRRAGHRQGARAARPRRARSTLPIICRPGRSSAIRAPAASAALLGRIVILDVTPFDVRSGGRAGADADLRRRRRRQHDHADLFQQSGLGEEATAAGRGSASSAAGSTRGATNGRSSIPKWSSPPRSATSPIREPVYPLTEGISNKRMRELALAGLERAPELAEWVEPSLLAPQHWPAWRAALAAVHSDPPEESARKRLSYDEIFANQLALLLLRQVARRKRGVPLRGDGRHHRQVALALSADRRAGAGDRGNSRRHGAGAADAAPAPGRRRVGQDAGRAAGHARGGRGGRAGGDARPDRNPRPPAFRDAAGAVRGDRRARRDPHRARERAARARRC